jgi:hypothetical protein
MYTTINEFEFRDTFCDMGRGDQFSYEALNILFKYYEELEESMDTQWELDVIAICCEWSEYDSWSDLQEDYTQLKDMTMREGIDWVQDQTQLYRVKETSSNSGLIEIRYLIRQF